MLLKRFDQSLQKAVLNASHCIIDRTQQPANDSQWREEQRMGRNDKFLPKVSYASHRSTEKSPRRLLIADFMIVIAVLAFVLYYFWPAMFEVPEPVVPDSVVRDVVAKFLQVRPDFEVANMQARHGVLSVEDAFNTKLFPHQSSINTATHVMVWTPSGNVIFGGNFWPQNWSYLNPPWLNQANRILIERSNETNHVVLVYQIPESEYTLIVFKAYKPVFSTDEYKAVQE